jgi:DNA repair exonuclease SbcCD ATPase subunit
MKIVEFVAENFKKLRVVEIQPGGKHMIQITGRNGQGKSTVLDGIWFGLKGQKALPANKASVVRNGTERAKVQVTLANGNKQGFTITRTLGAEGNPPTLTIQPAVHKEANKTPQEYLDDLFGALTFDPLAFVQMAPAEQVAELRKTAQIGVDFEKLAAESDEDYTEREKINREIKLLDGQIAGMNVLEGLPKQKIDEAAIVTKLNQAAESNRKAQETFSARQELGAAAARIGIEKVEVSRRIENKEKDLANLEKLVAAGRKELAAMQKEEETLAKRHKEAEDRFRTAPAGEPVDVGALTAELQSAQRTNRAIEQRSQYDQVKAERDAKKKKAEDFTRRMEGREEKKREAIAKAKMPVEGLTFDGVKTVKYNGVPFENLGEGEQIRIATLIGMGANPKLKIICIRRGEALDDEGLKVITELARKNDFQIWMARVDTSGKVGIVLEDGSIAATNEDGE